MIRRIEIAHDAPALERELVLSRARCGITGAIISQSVIAPTDTISITVYVRKTRNRNNNPIDVYYVSATAMKL